MMKDYRYLHSPLTGTSRIRSILTALGASIVFAAALGVLWLLLVLISVPAQP